MRCIFSCNTDGASNTDFYHYHDGLAMLYVNTSNKTWNKLSDISVKKDFKIYNEKY